MKKMKNHKINKKRIEIINLSKDLIIKYGWNDLLFQRIKEHKKINVQELEVLFPNGYKEMIRFFFDNLNQELKYKFINDDFSRIPVHKKIRKILITKLNIIKKDKIFFKRTFNYLLIPGNYKLLSRLLYNSVNNIWYVAQDNSTDFNFYTKRMILSGIYISVVLHFLNNNNMIETEKKLDDLLLKVSKIPKIKNRIKLFKTKMPFFNLIKNY
tara:strand:+ start:2528 stop:3163 length:636 start_codon:yes stop_codon:yes gene_type:complete